jgi:hypothetical protein
MNGGPGLSVSEEEEIREDIQPLGDKRCGARKKK